MAVRPGFFSPRAFVRYGPTSNRRMPNAPASGGLGMQPPGLVPYSGMPIGQVELASNGVMYRNQFRLVTDYDTTNTWTLTQVAGTGAATSGATGLVILNSGAAPDETDIQGAVGGKDNLLFNPAQGKLLFFESRIALTHASDVSWFVGLGIVDTTFIAGATDFIGFFHPAGATAIDFVSAADGGAGGGLIDKYRKQGVGTSSTSAQKLAFSCWATSATGASGTAEVHVFVDDVHVQTLAVTNVPNGDLVPTFAIKNASANARGMTISNLFIWNEF